MSDSPIPQMDLAWVLVSAGMVFLMQAGFLALEAGLTRTKNAINVAIKNITDFGLSLVLFWAVGFGLIFSPSLGGFIGSGLWIPNHQSLGHDGTAFLLFQGMFCGTAVTIVAGAVAERMRFGAYLVVAVLTSAFIYPVAAHWSWGGTEEGGLGWLRALGFVDFAGSGVVHAVGGAIALAAVLVLGPRIGRFSDEGAVRIPPSSLPMAMLGVMILWFGWIGFNGGSHLMMDEAVPRIILNTMLAGSAGLVSALITSHSRLGYAEPSAVICGSLGGLVSVTASCNVIDFSSAVLIGAVGGIVAVQACRWLERFNIDDAVDAIPVHLACGVWGTLAYGIFAPVGELAVDGGRAQQILVQAGGTLALTFSAFAFSYVTLRAINALFPLRVTPDAEEQGLNVAEHNAPSAMQDLLEAMDTQSAQRDLSLRAPVEPFTEIGKVAHRYNALMATLEGSLTSIAELEEAQAKLEAAREHAVEALETRSLFVANMSHELRTPMNAIIGFADLLLEEDFEPEETDEFLTLIKSSGAHLLELINDVLDLSKLEAGKLEIERLDFE
ncbi:MAG: ammonium transporter, partial [Planctomycetota bacterium]